MSELPTYQLIWLSDPDELFETDWIRELLSEVSYTEQYHPERSRTFQNAVIVFNHARHEVDYNSYFAKYEASGTPFIAVHLSDETLSASCEFYNMSMCRYVFRNYVHPSWLKHPKVRFFGLGYKTGFARKETGDGQSFIPWYQWCFVGTIHPNASDRWSAIQCFAHVFPKLLVTGDTFGKGVSIETYRDVLENSKFALCPIGQCNIDTYRFYEALEANCIPIVLTQTPVQPYKPSYWHFLFQTQDALPFLMEESWDKALQKMEQTLQDPAIYLNLKQRSKTFWQQAKRRWIHDWTQCVLRAFS